MKNSISETILTPPHQGAILRRVESHALALLGPYLSQGLSAQSSCLIVQHYLVSRPRKFFSRDAFRCTLDILFASATTGLTLPRSTVAELTGGLDWLRSDNASFPDRKIEHGDPLGSYKIQHEHLRRYAHIAEYVYFGLVGALIGWSPLARQQGKTPHVELKSRWNQAGRYLGRAISSCYDTHIRNAIVHGGVEYRRGEITFRDKKGREQSRSYDDCLSMSEQILDVCNGISLALAVFAGAFPGRLDQEVDVWAKEEHLLALLATPLLTPLSIRIEPLGANIQQRVLICAHRHWTRDLLMFDMARALILMKEEFSGEAERFFISAEDYRKTPSFAQGDSTEVPGVGSLTKSTFKAFLQSTISSRAMLNVEHRSAKHLLLSKSWFKHVASWVNASDSALGEVNYELRHMVDNSVARQARFRAVVVSSPREEDLDSDNLPRPEYLASIFLSTFARWLVREGEKRGFGVRRLRLFRSGIISISQRDGRIRQIVDAGLTEDLICRFEFALGRPKCGVGLGGASLVLRGPFWLSMNPKWHADAT